MGYNTYTRPSAAGARFQKKAYPRLESLPCDVTKPCSIDGALAESPLDVTKSCSIDVAPLTLSSVTRGPPPLT